MEKEKTEKKETDLATVKGSNIALGSRGIELRTLDELWRFANMAVKSRLIPQTIDTPEKALIVLQKGMEIGLSPMAALGNMYVVNNRPVLYGEIGLALIRASGQLVHFKQYYVGEFPKDDFRAVCEMGRRGEEIVTKEFSIGDAKTAQLWERNTWKPYPKDMLMWKPTWRASKVVFADILQGVDGAEDFSDAIDATHVETIRTEPSSKSDRLADLLNRPAEPETVGARMEEQIAK